MGKVLSTSWCGYGFRKLIIIFVTSLHCILDLWYVMNYLSQLIIRNHLQYMDQDENNVMSLETKALITPIKYCTPQSMV